MVRKQFTEKIGDLLQETEMRLSSASDVVDSAVHGPDQSHASSSVHKLTQLVLCSPSGLPAQGRSTCSGK